MQEQLQHIKQQLAQLIKQYQQVQKENASLQKELQKKDIALHTQSEQIEQLHRKVDGLKLKGSNLLPEEKMALQKRIDKYLKEIDACIDLLSKN